MSTPRGKPGRLCAQRSFPVMTHFWPEPRSAPPATFSRNLWLGDPCGSDLLISSLPYLNSLLVSPDYHLSGGLAVDLLPGANADQQLSTDHDGNPRPLGGGYDAGSDELR